MKIQLRQLLPTWIHTIYMCANTFGYDARRALRYCFGYNNDVENQKANLLMILHTLEKGLTMPNGRCGFGYDKIRQISSLVRQITPIESYSFELCYTRSILSEYETYHAVRQYQLPAEIEVLLSATKQLIGSSGKEMADATQLHFTADEFFPQEKKFSSFAISRHSCRNYSDRSIDKEIFIEVAKLANMAPSSCNRQSCRMHVVTEKETIGKVLEIQGGCRGFGHLATAVIVVTSDLHSFFDVQERAQPAINSGFFGMNILYALHDYGIGACVLNWSNTKKKDLILRNLVPTVGESEQIEFIISCGYTPKSFDVALSKRRPVEDCICFV